MKDKSCTVQKGKESKEQLMRYCCQRWPVGIQAVDSRIVYAFHHGWPNYPEYLRFAFCPWCGKRLPKRVEDR